jgi:hypothetical protein
VLTSPRLDAGWMVGHDQRATRLLYGRQSEAALSEEVNVESSVPRRKGSSGARQRRRNIQLVLRYWLRGGGEARRGGRILLVERAMGGSFLMV